MTKQDFLNRLEAELRLFVSPEVISRQLSYYSDYIDEQIQTGKSENEVVSELGDPRLLAKSITDAAEAGGDRVAVETPFRYTEQDINYNSDEEDRQYKGAAEDSGKSRETFRSFSERTEDEERPHFHYYSFDNRKHRIGCLMSVILNFFLLYFLIQLIGGALALLLPALFPVLIILVIIWIIVDIRSR